MWSGTFRVRQAHERAGQAQGDTLALAEAYFYVGQWGRVDAARDAFEKCRAHGITGYYEHDAAGYELARPGER